jgi:hypothetical protein
MPLNYVKHEPLSLRKHPDFSEVWLHDRIAADPSILGLGELDVIQREKVQFAGGRLDMLLADSENGIRYEVEIMLGATDPSHIIRTIEYWDIERRRYPAYDHVAVLVAEEVTTRFLNVMSLLAGSIPLIAIQLNALKVGEQIVLSFVNVMDQRQLREDDIVEGDTEDADRGTWEAKVGSANLKICDQVLVIANEKANPRLELKYKKNYLALNVPGQFANAMALFPKKSYVVLSAPSNMAQDWVNRLTEAELEATVKRGTRAQVRLTSQELANHEGLIRDLIHDAVKLHQE